MVDAASRCAMLIRAELLDLVRMFSDEHIFYLEDMTIGSTSGVP